MKIYKPSPIDTSQIKLPKRLEALTEHLAENVHERWAERRMKDGWTWGKQRNDRYKKHPTLIPYDELPENEKEYDRITSTETLKAVMALGYKIVRK
jgi:hypothetical protein